MKKVVNETYTKFLGYDLNYGQSKIVYSVSISVIHMMNDRNKMYITWKLNYSDLYIEYFNSYINDANLFFIL